MGGSGYKFPTMVIKEPVFQKVFSFEDQKALAKLGMLTFERFLTLFFEKKLISRVRSESADSSHSGHEHVVKVVGSNFDRVVLDSTHDVLLEVYAPWCDKCDRFESVLTEVADVLCTHAKGVVVAQMDATKNDIPVNVIAGLNGYPTLLLFPAAGKKEVLEYRGSRNPYDIVRFVQEHSTFKPRLPNELLVRLRAEKSSKNYESHDHSSHSPQMRANDIL